MASVMFYFLLVIIFSLPFMIKGSFSPNLVAVDNLGYLTGENNNQSMAVETLKVTWWSPDTNISISYYIVQWIPASNSGLIGSSTQIRHQGNQIEHVYDVNDFIHGECYNFTVTAFAANGENSSSTSVIFQTTFPSPYNATFIPNESGSEAKITWWMTVHFIVSRYVIDLFGSYGSKNYTYFADENSPTMFIVPLYSGLYYKNLSISLYADPVCGQSPNSLSLQQNILYFSEPPTPENVQLNLKKLENLNPNPTLIVSWKIPHSFEIFQYDINLVSKNGIAICQTQIKEEILNTTVLEYEATTTECTLNASTLYNATVQILSVDSNNQIYEKGNRSLPSNLQETAPAVVSDVKVTEIQDNRGIETGKLHVEWRKSDGGDEIDEFLIECKAGSFLLSETVSFISGQVNYEHNTTNVVQGVNISVTIYAINSAGNSSISSMISTAPPVPFNVTIQKPLCKNSEVDFVVSWNMPDPNLYFVLTYLIICEQLRRDILWDFIQGSELKATLSASCPGEIVSAKVIAFGFSSNSLGRFSEESLPYQTDFPVPTNVTLVRNGTRSLSISWNSEACTVDYKIQFVSMRGDVLEYEVYYSSNYMQPAFHLVPGEIYHATLQPFTEYGKGTPSLPSLQEQTEPHPVVNVTCKLNEDNPSEFIDISWNTIGVGDNTTIISQSNNGRENNLIFNSFAKQFLQIPAVPGTNYTINIFVTSYLLKSASHFEAITTKPEAPEFNCTATSLTSLEVNWFWGTTNAEYLIIKLAIESDIASYNVDPFIGTFRVENLVPYAEYKVSMYAAVYNQSGFEERSLPNFQTVVVFFQEFCEEAILQHPNDQVPVVFPRTQAGYTNSTVEACFFEDNAANNGVPYGTRLCNIRAEWEEPVWLSSCLTTLEDLAEKNITNDVQRKEVATDLAVLTSNPSSLSSESIEQSANTLRSIVDTDELEQNTTTLIIESVGNLLAAPEEELQSSGVQDSLLLTLDEITFKVFLEEGEEYQSTATTLSLAVVEVTNQKATLSGIGYKENNNPFSENLGFSQGQFQTFNSKANVENSSSIFLPSDVVSISKMGRVSFYVFADNSLFMISRKSTSSSSNVVIGYDATVQSTRILSASIQKPAENLKDNVTIVFEYNEALCPTTDKLEECGEYLCGFWDEEKAVWLKSGCTLTSMSEILIECQCNHLTNFATLFAYGSAITITNNIIYGILTYVCCGVSLFGSLLTIAALFIVWNSKKPTIAKSTSFIMINLSFALTLLNGFLLISNVEAIIEDKNACTAIAIVLHFSLFSTLLWTSVEASYVCIGIVAPFYYRTRLSLKGVIIASSILGWGVPAAFVGLTAGISIEWYQKPNESLNTCWISTEKVIYLVIIPASVILIINTIVYFTVVVTHAKRKNVGESVKKTSQTTTSQSIFFSLSLFSMFGITWIFGFLLFGSTTFNEVFAYIFTVTTGLQGILIFILFVVRNKKIRETVHLKMNSLQSDLTSKNVSSSIST